MALPAIVGVLRGPFPGYKEKQEGLVFHFGGGTPILKAYPPLGRGFFSLLALVEAFLPGYLVGWLLGWMVGLGGRIFSITGLTWH